MKAGTHGHRYFVMMRYQQVLFLLVLLGVFFCGCKKDPANEAPRITIITPYESASVTVPDTPRDTISEPMATAMVMRPMAMPTISSTSDTPRWVRTGKLGR